MTREELEKRIEKKNSDIAKIQKRIAKWSKGLRPEDIAVCEPFGNCVYGDIPRYMDWRDYHGTPEYQKATTAYRQYLKDHDNDIPRAEDWNKGPNIGELQSAYRDLGEARHTLEKYTNQINALNEFETKEKIPAIWDFLMQWREKAYDYYMDQVKDLHELKTNHEAEINKYISSDRYKEDYKRYQERGYRDWNISSILRKSFDDNYYSGIDSLTFKIYEYGGKANTDLLNKTLDKDVEKKYNRLENDVREKAGDIVDASNLRINARGEINGRIKGTKNDVDLWLTFVVGEVQCPHYRGYCHPAKN